MLVEIHLLKNHVPANLNRDETGSPKDCIFGGVSRARISSQCLKHSIRQSELFKQAIGEEMMGVRTRKMPECVGEILRERGMVEELVNEAEQILVKIGQKDKDKDKENKDDCVKKIQTEQVLFYSKEDLKALADLMEDAIHNCNDNVKELKKIKLANLKKGVENKRPVSVDIALFGRMVTDTVMRNVESAIQVAHAISTNKLQREFDYFTAVDDLLKEGEEIGAGMIGDIEYNSSCFYEYFSFDMDEFIKNLSCGRENNEEEVEGIAQKALLAFIEASIFITPTGKQNTFAAHQLPSAIYIEIKSRKIPVSFANAFVKPAVYSKNKDMEMDSVEKLAAHIDLINRKYFSEEKADNRFWFTMLDGVMPQNAQNCDSFAVIKEKIKSTINKGR